MKYISELKRVISSNFWDAQTILEYHESKLLDKWRMPNGFK